MRSPQEIELSGLERKASLASPIGRIELRWTRETERLFGQTPERATIGAATTVAKALRQSSFPTRVKSINPNWNIVFLNKDLKAGQVPNILLSNCHPGWMTPPANIYIASEQAAGSCAGSQALAGKIADARLSRVLIHEIGHAVEYALGPNIPLDRARSEGFATWFEVFAGRYSGILDAGSILSEQKFLARQKITTANYEFNGGAEDYALASSIFHVLTEDRAVSDLTRVYDTMTNSRVSFPQALSKVMGLSDKQIEDKLQAFIGK